MVAALGLWVGACGAAVVFERVADGVYAHVGDIVYVDGLLAVLPVSSTRAWLDAFTALEQWAPRRAVQSGSVIGEIPDQVGIYQQPIASTQCISARLCGTERRLDGLPAHQQQGLEVGLSQGVGGH